MKALSAEWMKLMRNNAINSLYSKMDIKLETTRGYYNPSFLKLTVNADCDLSNLNLLNKAHFSTFYHEYIHFLQDLTTTFGVTNAAIIANRLMFYNEQFRNSPDQFVKVKIPLIDQNGANSKLNAELQNLYQGTGNLRSGVQDLHILSVAICDSNIFLPDPFSKYAKGVRVCIDLNGSTKTLQFGGLHHFPGQPGGQPAIRGSQKKRPEGRSQSPSGCTGTAKLSTVFAGTLKSRIVLDPFLVHPALFTGQVAISSFVKGHVTDLALQLDNPSLSCHII